jgi:predicted metal-dependent enzyme (double-stranded beta helix superfamily)
VTEAAVAIIAPDRLAPLRQFVGDLSALIDRTDEEPDILAEGSRLLAELIATDDWLPDTHAAADPARYRQYVLYRDPAARFSVVSFVWGPGQSTPIHDHTVWGLIGVLRGAELAERYVRDPDGLRSLGEERLETNEVDAVSPAVGDLHRVTNPLADSVSISIHVYGADIGAVRRATYDLSGQAKPFVSGYAEAPTLPL